MRIHVDVVLKGAQGEATQKALIDTGAELSLLPATSSNTIRPWATNITQNVRGVHGDIVPMQDLLGLGKEARMNKPGTVGNENWRWRLSADGLSEKVTKRLSDITVKTGRA